MDTQIELDEFFTQKGITAELNRIIGATERNYSGVVSPNYRLVAIGDEKGFVRVFDLATGELIYTFFDFPDYEETQYIVGDLAITPDGKYLFQIIEEEILMRVWDLETGSVVYRLTDDNTFFRTVITPDSQKAVTLCGNDDIRIWDVKTGEKLHSFTDDDNYIWGINVSADGQKLVLSCKGIIKVFDLESYQLLNTITYSLLQKEKVFCPVVFSPNNQLLAIATPEQVNIFDINTGNLLNSLKKSSWVELLAISPDNRILITANYGEVNFWQINSGELIYTYSANFKDIMALQVSKDKLAIVYSQEETKVLILNKIDWSTF